MKRTNLIIACSIVFAGLVACSDSGNSTTKTDTPSVSQGTDTNNAMNTPDNSMNNSGATTTPTNMMPYTKEDSMFAVKAAVGGMMEIESSNVALQNSTNDRVKMYAQMMVTDHTKAASELSSLASSHGMMLPTALPADKQKHIDGMKAMKGKAFDKHYIDMMLNDHKKTVSDFEKEVSSGSDADLKAWAAKTLPTLKMHRDSVVALSKMKM